MGLQQTLHAFLPAQSNLAYLPRGQDRPMVLRKLIG
jgi:hypothetical protein